MFLKRIKSEIVSQISYFIGSDNEAIVVDPRRDCHIYVKLAKRKGMRIKYIFETHRNEDYVIGSIELASLTGAEIYHGPWPEFKYGKVLRDGQEFEFGRLRVKAIHTPGHTPGCMSYAVSDLDSGEETVLVCTGDTLFVNDVGRTDFGGPNKRREWSENLYDSIFNKLLPLGDHVILCPAHGAGSVCGTGIADREWSTLGLERLMNPILQQSKEEFIEYKVNEHHEYPPYFRLMEKYNVKGAPFVGCGPNPRALSPKEFKEDMNKGAIVLDARSPSAFGGAHIIGSYSIPLRVLNFVGWLLPYDKSILLVIDDKANLNYAARSLVRIGYDKVKGYIGDGLNSWLMEGYPTESSGLLSVSELKKKLDSGEKWTLLDVRSRNEWEEGHIKESQNIYVGAIEKRLKEVPKDFPIVVICGSGNLASIGASILLRSGRHEVYNLLGGMSAWENRRYPISE